MIQCRTSSSVKRAFVRASHGAEHPQLRTGKQQYDLWIVRIQIHLRTIHFWTTFFGSNVSDSNPSCMPFRRHLGRKVEAFWLQNRQRSCNNHRRTWLWGSRLRSLTEKSVQSPSSAPRYFSVVVSTETSSSKCSMDFTSLFANSAYSTCSCCSCCLLFLVLSVMIQLIDAPRLRTEMNVEPFR